MRYGEFIERTMERAGLQASGEAKRLVEVTLETLGERLSKTERDNLAAQLPPELREPLFRRNQVRFSLEDFYTRVSARAEVGYPQAVEGSRSVMLVLQEAISPGKIRNTLNELPPEFDELFGSEPEGPLSPSRG